MGFVALECPRCGASIPPGANGTVVCAYCRATLVETTDGFRVSDAFADEDLVDPHLLRFWLAGKRYRVEGRIARGDSSDVLLARRDDALGERVVAKVLRTLGDRDRLENEWATTTSLSRSTAKGCAHFTRLLPQPVAHGDARFGRKGSEGEAYVSIYRYESGFVHDFAAIRSAYPDGIPANASVWIQKRILEVLAFVHSSNLAHGAILPRHLLVHARDHGVRPIGFTSSGRIGEKLEAIVDADRAFYPAGVTALDPEHDIAMTARSVLWILGGNPMRAPSTTPSEIAHALETSAQGNGPTTALDALAAVDAAAQAAFGPPRYIPFAMPGWG